MTTKTLYQTLIDAGTPASDMDHHESDLYVKLTPQTRAVLDNYNKNTYTRIFTSNVDGQRWIEAPFAYDPFWARVRTRAHS